MESNDNVFRGMFTQKIHGSDFMVEHESLGAKGRMSCSIHIIKGTRVGAGSTDKKELSTYKSSLQ